MIALKLQLRHQLVVTGVPVDGGTVDLVSVNVNPGDPENFKLNMEGVEDLNVVPYQNFI